MVLQADRAIVSGWRNPYLTGLWNVCPSSARNPVFERNVNECLGDLSIIDMKESETCERIS